VLRVLLDTNQLISSLVSTRGPQRELVDAWRRRAFLLLLTAEQLEEVREVLGRPKIARKYRISPADRQAFLDLLRAEVILLPDEPAPGVCRDPDDDHLLGCAAAGGVEYLVTGDRDLLSVRRFRETSIVDARAFLGLLST
jgi:putative PIN family toxin of toxin-antitoxin system